MVLAMMMRGAVGECRAAWRNVEQSFLSVCSLHTSSSVSAPSRDAPPGRHLLRTHPHLDKEEARPPLGAWPNFEPGVDKPTQVSAPQPTWEMAHTKNIIVGDASDATEISEYDRIKENQSFGGGGAASIAGVTDTT